MVKKHVINNNCMDYVAWRKAILWESAYVGPWKLEHRKETLNRWYDSFVCLFIYGYWIDTFSGEKNER